MNQFEIKISNNVYFWNASTSKVSLIFEQPLIIIFHLPSSKKKKKNLCVLIVAKLCDFGRSDCLLFPMDPRGFINISWYTNILESLMLRIVEGLAMALHSHRLKSI